ncbi:MAG: hypothetical protein RLZZ283_532 [Candidatus Parcubacteria bacterium]|jgi:DNA-binding CsgD family transcriptional regulator
MKEDIKYTSIDDLSPREWEVMNYMVKGNSDRKVGKILGISPRTARFHVDTVKDRLGLPTRVAVADWFGWQRGQRMAQKSSDI